MIETVTGQKEKNFWEHMAKETNKVVKRKTTTAKTTATTTTAKAKEIESTEIQSAACKLVAALSGWLAGELFGHGRRNLQIFREPQWGVLRPESAKRCQKGLGFLEQVAWAKEELMQKDDAGLSSNSRMHKVYMIMVRDKTAKMKLKTADAELCHFLRIIMEENGLTFPDLFGAYYKARHPEDVIIVANETEGAGQKERGGVKKWLELENFLFRGAETKQKKQKETKKQKEAEEGSISGTEKVKADNWCLAQIDAVSREKWTIRLLVSVLHLHASFKDLDPMTATLKKIIE